MLSKVRRRTRICLALEMIAQAMTGFFCKIKSAHNASDLTLPAFHSSTFCYASLTKDS